MSRLQAKKIAKAIQKAQGVGVVEESFTVMGVTLVLRSLRPAEYEDALDAISELEETKYINGYKIEHLARSVVEIEGESLRNVDFVEVDVEDMDVRTGRSETKTISLERHQFVKDYILASWGREGIDVGFRKFRDVVDKAEKETANGIKFEVPDETADDKYRRLLAEVKEIEGSVPFELANKIREEHGYLLKQEMVKTVEDEAPLAPPSEPEPEPASPPPAPPPAPVAAPPMRQSTAAVMRQPVVQSEPPPAPPPRQAPLPPAVVNPAVLRRAAEIQEAEGLDSLTGEVGSSPQTAFNPHAEQPRQARDINAALETIDRPPVAGINPRYRPPPRT